MQLAAPRISFMDQHLLDTGCGCANYKFELHLRCTCCTALQLNPAQICIFGEAQKEQGQSWQYLAASITTNPQVGSGAGSRTAVTMNSSSHKKVQVKVAGSRPSLAGSPAAGKPQSRF